MRIHNFYVKKFAGEVGENKKIENSELVHQLRKVFRYKGRESLNIVDGEGSIYECDLIGLGEGIGVEIKSVEQRDEENNVALFPSIIKKDNLELVIQKCTELGVKEFRPIITERTEKKEINLERLNKIAIEAIEQSGQTVLSKIHEPQKISEVIKDRGIIFYALEKDGRSVKNIDTSKKIGILIGPEGGWSEKELNLFNEKNIPRISVGDTTLRAETASIAIVSKLI